jgi:DNA-binding response OmpR family regulator
MPHLSGLDVLRQVKEIDSEISVLIMTATPSISTFTLAVEYGAREYLAKPIALSVVRQGIGDLIDRTYAFDQHTCTSDRVCVEVEA